MSTEPAGAIAPTTTTTEHKPYVPEETVMPELTLAPVIVGAILGIIFGATSLYLVLRVGMTVSASIPIAVLSITLFRVFGGGANILQNNIVQTTGSAGESIAFGVGVTMPALMILGYNIELVRVMLVAVLGGLLGVLMMIPLRRVFIVKQHGKLAYPEGVACADVLIVGEKGGSSAATVFAGFGLAFVYQFVMNAYKFWSDVPKRLLKFERADGSTIFEFKNAQVSIEAHPALLGVGYVIGPRISCIMVAGGVLAWWVFIPMIKFFGEGLSGVLYPGPKLISEMTLKEVFDNYVLYIGAGAVAAGGIISMIQSMPAILHSIRAGFSDLAGKKRTAGGEGARTAGRLDRDMSMKVVVLGSIGLVIAIWAAPVLEIDWYSAVLIVAFGFLFVTVSARLTGEVGSSSNPISGMTVATLLLTCLIFVSVGWTGEVYRLAAMSIAAIVCIASSNGGTVAQALKTGYIVGATPRNQQVAILVGALTSALVIGVTLLFLNNTATIYSKKDLPDFKVDESLMKSAQLERAGGEYSSDTKEYRVFFARAGAHEGVAEGKYLVDETGAIQYLVDRGINGRLDKRDNGEPVTKFDAPKARLMSFIVDGILTQQLPWSLVLLGVSIAVVLELSGVPSLPFAVGVYLPLWASTPIFVGGMIRYIADRAARRTPAESEMSPGVLMASGYIAGAIIAAIVAIILLEFETTKKWFDLGGQEWLAGKLASWRMSPAIQEFAKSEGFTMVPFGLLMLVLLIVGARRSKTSHA